MAAYSLVQRAVQTITNGDAGNSKNFALSSAVKLGSAYVVSSVMENRAGNARGAIARILDATTVQVQWPGTLAGGETITVSYEVFDIDDIGDDVKELLFRLERVLGHLGENSIQDKIDYNSAGAIIAYRLRLFDTKAHAESANIGTTGGLETGETARISVTQNVEIGKNDRTDLLRVRTDLIPTPGIS